MKDTLLTSVLLSQLLKWSHLRKHSLDRVVSSAQRCECVAHSAKHARFVQGKSAIVCTQVAPALLRSSLLCQKKERPPDNERYVAKAPLDPKSTRWHFHDDTV